MITDDDRCSRNLPKQGGLSTFYHRIILAVNLDLFELRGVGTWRRLWVWGTYGTEVQVNVPLTGTIPPDCGVGGRFL